MAELSEMSEEEHFFLPWPIYAKKYSEFQKIKNQTGS